MKKHKTMNQSLKIMLILSAMLIMTLAIAMESYGALSCAFVKPSTGGTINNQSGTGKFNITFAGGEGNATVTARFNASSSATANSSTRTFLFSQTNLSGAVLMANGTVNASLPATTILEDGATYTITASVEGPGESSQCSGSPTNVIVDRTNPTIPSAISPTGSSEDPTSTTFSATVNDATTTGCILNFNNVAGGGANPGQANYPMTYSTTGCTLTLNNVPRGDYTYRVRATDGTDLTNSAFQTYSVSQSGNTARTKYLAITAIQKGDAIPLSIAGDSTVSVGGNSDFFSNELTAKELTKTGAGAVIGGVIGASGFLGGPLGFITVPVGAFIGGVIGAVV